MELTHTFTVPAPVAATWAAFEDIESVAGCFPGAVVTDVDGDDFKGSCKVKLGPIALVYTGTGSFLEKDEAARTFVVEAKGKDKRGNGTAGATVRASLADAAGGTEVTVNTDLAITGKPAQFGRGVIEDVSNKLLGQFVDCLEQKVAGPAGAEAAETGPGGGAEPEPPPEPGVTPGAAPPGGPVRQLRPEPEREADEVVALDLGATVLPALARAYWKQVLGLVLLALVVRRLLRRGS